MLHLCLLDCLIFLWQWRFSFLASSFFTSKIFKLAGLLEETTLWKKFLLKYFHAILLLQTSFIQANWFSNVELIEPENMYFLAGKRKKYQENSWLFQNTIYRLNLFFFPLYLCACILLLINGKFAYKYTMCSIWLNKW